MTTHDPAAPVSPEIERQVAEIVARPYRKVITGDATDGFLATVPDLPGCVTAGETAEEALALLHDAMEGWLISVLERDLPVPEPSGAVQYSGKVMVRMPKSLHRRLMERAEEEGVSANQLAVAILAEGLATREDRRAVPSAEEVHSSVSQRFGLARSDIRRVVDEEIAEEQARRVADEPSVTSGGSTS